MNRRWFVGLILLLAVTAAIVLYVSKSEKEVQTREGAEQVIDEAVPTHKPTPRRIGVETADFQWKVEPITKKTTREWERSDWYRVTLIAFGTTYNAGEHRGCNGFLDRPMLSGEIARIHCWFAGAGTEVSVFLEDGQYVLKERWVQETGNLPDVEHEGPWETRLIIQQ